MKNQSSSYWPRLCLLALFLLMPMLGICQVVGSFSPARAGDAGYSSQDSFKAMVLDALPNATFSQTDTLTSDYLKTVDVLVLGVTYDGGGSQVVLSYPEQCVLRDYVLQGKGAILFGENSAYSAGNSALLGTFGVSVVSGFVFGAVPILDPNNPVTGNSDVDPVGSLDLAYAGGLSYGSNSIPLATLPDGNAAAVYLPYGALFPGSGGVVAFGDSLPYNFTDGNVRIFENSLKYVAQGQILPSNPNAVRIGTWDVFRGDRAGLFQYPEFQDAIRETFAFASLDVQFVPFNRLDSNLVDRVDVLLMDSVSNGNTGGQVPPLDSDEQQALVSAVAQGKGVLLGTDSDGYYASSQSLLAPLGFSSAGNYNAVFDYIFAQPLGNPLSNGPFGQISNEIAGYSAWFTGYPSNAIPIAYLPNGQLGVMMIPSIGGSGVVAAFSDINVYDVVDSQNRAFFQNTLFALAPQTRDVTPPTTILSYAASGSNFVVTLVSHDSQSGVYETYYKIDSDDKVTYSTPFSVSNSVPHTISYWSRDVANNVETPIHSVTLLAAITTNLTLTAPDGIVDEKSKISILLKQASGAVVAGRTVRIMIDGTLVKTVTTNTAGKASATVVYPEPAGTHVIAASFDGDTTYAPSNASANVSVSSVDTVVIPAAITGPTGKKLRLTAKLTRANDGGAVVNRTLVFSVDGIAVGMAQTSTGGVASLAYQLPSVGTHNLSVEFAGDSSFHASSGASIMTVDVSATSLKVTNVVGTAGRQVKLTAHLTRTSDNAKLLGESINLIVNGVAIPTTPTDANGNVTAFYVIPLGTPTGPLAISASYNGSSSYLLSTGTGILTVR